MQREIGGYYHIYNRGVDKRTIFNEERDRWRFLQAVALFRSIKNHEKTLWELENSGKGANMKTLRNYFKRNQEELLVKVIANCLMDNHYHFILKEEKENGIAKFMQKFGTSYSMYFNGKYDRTGKLWEGSYKRVEVDSDLYLQYLLVYINVINPGEIIQPDLKEVGAKNIDKIMNYTANYRWSTHKEFLQTRNSFVINKDILGRVFNDAEKYREFCKMVLRSEKYKQIKHLTFE